MRRGFALGVRAVACGSMRSRAVCDAVARGRVRCILCHRLRHSFSKHDFGAEHAVVTGADEDRMLRMCVLVTRHRRRPDVLRTAVLGSAQRCAPRRRGAYNVGPRCLARSRVLDHAPCLPEVTDQTRAPAQRWSRLPRPRRASSKTARTALRSTPSLGLAAFHDDTRVRRRWRLDGAITAARVENKQ